VLKFYILFSKFNLTGLKEYYVYLALLYCGFQGKFIMTNTPSSVKYTISVVWYCAEYIEVISWSVSYYMCYDSRYENKLWKNFVTLSHCKNALKPHNGGQLYALFKVEVK
jgi:hypothetical protein